MPILANPSIFSVTVTLKKTFRGMSDLETRMGILEHRMDNNEEQNRRLEDELVRSRMEVRDAFQRLDMRIDETNRRIDQLQNNLSQQILELAAQTNRIHRWIIAVALFIVTVLPVTFKLADRWL
ncbi:MAG: hypothetical protein CMN76_12960 [Spirochaetaceae bacterium]|nr:hypothetical protein [Spirochaetaceae bacterium]